VCWIVKQFWLLELRLIQPCKSLTWSKSKNVWVFSSGQSLKPSPLRDAVCAPIRNTVSRAPSSPHIIPQSKYIRHLKYCHRSLSSWCMSALHVSTTCQQMLILTISTWPSIFTLTRNTLHCLWVSFSVSSSLWRTGTLADVKLFHRLAIWLIHQHSTRNWRHLFISPIRNIGLLVTRVLT